MIISGIPQSASKSCTGFNVERSYMTAKRVVVVSVVAHFGLVGRAGSSARGTWRTRVSSHGKEESIFQGR